MDRPGRKLTTLNPALKVTIYRNLKTKQMNQTAGDCTSVHSKISWSNLKNWTRGIESALKRTFQS
jgi:hypothetical protein